MLLLGLGVVFAAPGTLGVALAPQMIEARREEGLLDDSHDEIADGDGILATRGMGAVFVVVGLFPVGYRLFGT